MSADACLLVFTKPARPGRVKTRLTPELSPQQAAALHGAFLEDLLERLEGGAWEVQLAWALDPGEAMPPPPRPGLTARRQEGADLGERLYRALTGAGRRYRWVAALGSDHPHVPLAAIDDAFARLAGGAEVVLGPAGDGGYYLVAVPGAAVPAVLFTDVPWSSEGVLATTRRRAAAAGLAVELLEPGWDVDRPRDLRRLAAALAAGNGGSVAAAEAVPALPRTRALLASWGRLPAAEAAEVVE